MSKKSSRYLSLSALIFFAVCVVALVALRFLGLDEKPPHHDETINGWFVMQMWSHGFYKYDPSNYHGPLLFYLFQWAEILFGSSIETMRGLTSFFSALTVGLFLYVGFFKKRSAFIAGAFALALSPAAEFFGRSAIHESVFVFFMGLMLFSIFFEEVLLWAFAGLVAMMLLKETWVLWVISIAIAVVRSKAWQLSQVSNEYQRFVTNSIQAKRLLYALGVGALVIALFFSGFFQNMQGVLDFFMAFLPWTKTGVGGAGHEKPWWTWIHWFSLYEWPTLALSFLSIVGIFLKDRKIQFFSTLSMAHLILFSIIPYKTPWCLLSIQLPLIFSGIFVLEHLLDNSPLPKLTSKKNWAYVFVAFLGFCQWPQMKALTWASPIQLDHPYVYVQTQYDVKLLIQHLEKAEMSLSLQKIQVATNETWPFPWLLRKFPKVVYGNSKSEPDLEAAVILFDEDQAARVRPTLSEAYWERILPVRQSRTPAVLFLRKDLLEQVGVF